MRDRVEYHTLRRSRRFNLSCDPVGAVVTHISELTAPTADIIVRALSRGAVCLLRPHQHFNTVAVHNVKNLVGREGEEASLVDRWL